MNRRQFLGRTAALSTGLGALGGGNALFAANPKAEPKSTAKKLTPPTNAPVMVGILVSEHVNVIDFSGPWGVFESVSLLGSNEPPFRLLAVSDTTELVTSASGLKIKPDHTIDDVPKLNVVVIPAQKGSDKIREWLRKTVDSTDVTMSVCTGAFQLARAGLLNGLSATTHHEFLDDFEKSFPEIKVKRGVRFVENDKISTAGGLTSGTDLALRVVERYFGREVAKATALYMEYRGSEWMV